MSMLVFYINQAGKSLDNKQLNILEQAKDELRALYGKQKNRYFFEKCQSTAVHTLILCHFLVIPMV